MGEDSHLWTILITPAMESAVDPMVEEITWVGYRMIGANPRSLTTHDSVLSAAGILDVVVETLWDPGRVVVFTELSAFGRASPNGLSFCVMFGMMGSEGRTAVEAEAARHIFDALVAKHGFPYAVAPVHPWNVLNLLSEEVAHTALIRQRTVTVDVGEEQIEVLSRWHPLQDSWSPISRVMLERGVVTRVRATALATELSLDDRLSLQSSFDQVHRLTDGNLRPDHRYSLDRATSTLVDLKASFGSPLLAAEVAIASTDPLPDSTLRAIGCSITSQADTTRLVGHVVVGGQRLLLGGYEIQRDHPTLPAALRQGLPLHGGIGPRGLRDVITLAESPIGWPIPCGGPIPTIPTLTARPRPVPQELRDGEFIGFSYDGTEIRVPLVDAGRHALVLGETGSGKSTYLVAGALSCLRAGRPFVLIDPHGQAADRIIGIAQAEGIPLEWLDAADGGSSALSPFPKLRNDQGNLQEATLAIGRFCDAVANVLPNPEWAGPRWRHHAMALGYLAAAHGVSLADALSWYVDPTQRVSAMSHRALPRSARQTLRLLNMSQSADLPELIDWVICKLDAIATGPAERILVAPGNGIDLDGLVSEGRSLVVNLAGMGATDGTLIGHLILSGVLDAAINQTDLRHLYHVYVDEAPRFEAKGIERIMCEGRKFQVSLTLAAQSLNQFSAISLRDAVTATSVKLAFRQSPEGSQHLAYMFDVMPHELSDQPDLHAFVRVSRYPATTIRIPPYEPAPARVRLPVLPRSRRRSSPKSNSTKEKGLAGTMNPVGWIDDWLERRGSDQTGDDLLGRREKNDQEDEQVVDDDLLMSDTAEEEPVP
jgi:hypothetical protein